MRNPLESLTGSQLWAIRPETFTALVYLLHANTPMESSGWEAAAPSTISGRGTSKIAVVPIQGVLTQDGPAWYGSNYDGISKAVEAAASDPDVKRILLTVDSPGGQVMGCPEAGAVIARAAKVKPVSAIVTGQAASAAYWLTSQATDITLTPSGEVGCVGVKMLHADISKMLDNEGVKITELSAGVHKTEWSPYKPLSEEAQAYTQGRMDKVHAEFLNVIATARGERASAEIREKRFGEGRMFSANDAMNHGLVDAVMSPRDFYRSMAPPVEQELSAPAFPIRASLAARMEFAKKRDQV